MIEPQFLESIAREANVTTRQVSVVLTLLDEGATIPFLSRYRKDRTGDLNEEAIELIQKKGAYFSSLSERRASILSSIEKQGQLTDDLRERILACMDKTSLEELYLPYKPRRRTRATIAREQGLGGLAEFLLAQDEVTNEAFEARVTEFVDESKGVPNAEAALEGARLIISDMVALDAESRSLLRNSLLEQGVLKSHATKNTEGKKTKFEAYYDFSESVAKIPSHRFLAITRGNKEGMLRVELAVNDSQVLDEIKQRYIKHPNALCGVQVAEAVDSAYRRQLRPSIENEVLTIMRERADEEAIRVFRANAESLLLAPPAGRICVLGVDPGMRTGCKLAVVGPLGEFIENTIIYPTPPHNKTDEAEETMLALVEKHNVQAIAIGNGTGARETAQFVSSVLKKIDGRRILNVLVNEAGASVYSASLVAREEYPDLDATVRGAISIAHRLQDPLAELVKIDPKHIGVGQYQHDVDETALREGLEQTVTNCVNRVGVDVNTASPALLEYVSGVPRNVAHNIVLKRNELGGFSARSELNSVPGIGPKIFEQCAGFLRILNGVDPLDATAIHPEAYPTVQKIAENLSMPVDKIVANPEALKGIDLSAFESENIGPLVLEDMRQELMKPGRDPRKEFRAPEFLEGVDTVDALAEGMEMEGVVTNVTDFGAFMDIGVHHDGLVHLSQLAHHFVKDPRDVVKVGDIFRVRVIGVDKDLPRVSLSRKALIPAPRKNAPKRAARKGTGAKHQEHSEPSDRQAGKRKESRSHPRSERHDTRKTRKRPHKGKDEHRGGAKDEALHNPQLSDQLSALRDKFK